MVAPESSLAGGGGGGVVRATQRRQSTFGAWTVGGFSVWCPVRTSTRATPAHEQEHKSARAHKSAPSPDVCCVVWCVVCCDARPVIASDGEDDGRGAAVGVGRAAGTWTLVQPGGPQGQGDVLNTNAAEMQGNGGVLDTKVAETQGKGGVFAHHDSWYLPSRSGTGGSMIKPCSSTHHSSGSKRQPERATP